MARGYLTRLGRTLRRVRTDDQGATMIEFGMLAPVIFLATIGLFEASMLVSVKSLLDAGTREAARFGVTGEVVDGQTREETIFAIVLEHAGALIEGSAINVSTKAYTDYYQLTTDPDAGIPGPGESSEVVVYSVSYQQPLMTPFLETIFGVDHIFQTARVVVQNEPFGAE